jgi:glucokinase
MIEDGRPEALLAVDMGATQLRTALVDFTGRILLRHARLTPRAQPDALAAAMRDTLKGAGGRIAGAVVGVPGSVSYADGAVVRLPNLLAWEGHISGRSLADAVGLPVVVANDADLGALGEHRYGAGKGVSDLVYVTVSTGVGGGAVLGGQLVHGRRSLAEIGWTVVDIEGGRTVEELGAGPAIERASGLDSATLVARVRAGDDTATRHWQAATRALAIGVMNLVLCFMPERVVIGGGVSNAGDLLLDPIREWVAREGPRMAILPEIVLAGTGDNAGLLGAAALWSDIEAGRAGSIAVAMPRAKRAQR